MAKRKIEGLEISPIKSIRFTKEFDGCFNGYEIKVFKKELGRTLDVPEDIYKWIQKFKVCEDA